MAIALNNHVFKGHRTLLGNKFVTYGEVELPLRLDIYSKSQSGFDWGSSNSSAKQLAFSMLYQISDKETALSYVDKFTQEIVKSLNSRDWVMSASEVLEWIDTHCETTPQKEAHMQQFNNLQTKKTSVKKIKKTNVVKEICRELNITQKNLAEILEVPEGTISSWAVKNEIPRLGKKAIEFYIENRKNQKIVDSYKNFISLLQAS